MRFSDKDLKIAREKGRECCGARWTVNGQRMNKRQIAEYVGKGEGYVWTCLQTEPIEHFLKRMGK